jgi:dienelactone hydrolase
MLNRNFSMIQYWKQKAKNWKPELAFTGNCKEDWEAWYKCAYPKLMELLWEFPQKVDLNPEVQYSVEDNGIIRERVVFDSEDFMSVPCYVLRPKDMKPNRANPAIICSHGHYSPSGYGKDWVAGVNEKAREQNQNYGEQMARAGFLTICPGVRIYGEKIDGDDPYPGCDPCNIEFIKGVIMGINTLTLSVWDSKCCIDYLETRMEVDPERIGMMGLSGGGTITTFTSAADKRIKAADIMGYINPWAAFGIERANFCGSQILPQVYKYFDTDEIAGLITPRPLLLEMGIFDKGFYFEDLMKGYKGVKQIYEAAGVGDRLWTDIFPGPHAFGGNKAAEFFNKYL